MLPIANFCLLKQKKPIFCVPFFSFPKKMMHICLFVFQFGFETKKMEEKKREKIKIRRLMLLISFPFNFLGLRRVTFTHWVTF